MRADALPPEVERELAAIDDALAGRPVEADLADLALLVRDLREERPRIADAFGRELDDRVAAGFKKEPGRRPRMPALGRPWMPALGLAATLLVALAVSFSALRGSDGDDVVPGGAGGSAAPELDSSGGGSAAPSSGAEDAGRSAPGYEPGDGVTSIPPVPGPGSPRSDRRTDRKVERSASLSLVAHPDRIQEVADGIVRVADALRGFVVTSSVQSGDGGAGGSFELRVPSNRLEQALAQLSRLAHVRERQQATVDITAESVSARSRLADARAERKSLLRRLERATTDAETDAIRARLRDVSLRIRTARADLARVGNRAAFSTVVVSLSSDPAAREGDEEDGVWSPADAFDDAVRVLEVVVGVALVTLAVLLPLALLAFAALVGHRLVRRRRRERALDAA